MQNDASHRRVALAAMASNTGLTSVGERAMTRRISAVAACCSSNRRRFLRTLLIWRRAYALESARSMNALVAWYFVAVWGAGYVATKAGLQYAAPFTFLSLRFLFALICLAPVLLLWRARWPSRGVEWAHLAIAGLLMHVVQLGGSHYAQYLGMSAGVAA